jgi:hypothetical protein
MEIENTIQPTQKKPFFKSKAFVIPMIAIMLLGIVSAAVYVYVSNTSTVTVNINQAMQTWLGNGAYDPASNVLTLSAFGGSAFNFIINERNIGTSSQTVYPVLLEITGPENFNGNELKSVILVDASNPGGIDVLPYLQFIRSDGSYAAFTAIGSEGTKTVKLMGANVGGTNLDTFDFNGGVTHVSDITITTEAGIAPGTYTIKACTINNLVGATCL